MVGYRFFRMAAAVAVFLTSVSAQVYPPKQGDLAVSIPFAFDVVGRAMAAGEYIVHHDAERAILRICEDGVYCVDVPARLPGGNLKGRAPRLTFHRTGGRVTLALVDCGSQGAFPLPDCPAAIARGADSAAGSLSVPARFLTVHVFAGLAPAWS